MSRGLSEVLLAPGTRPEAVRVLSRVVDEEVAATHGLGGIAVKTAYAAVRRLDRGVVPRAVEEMLPDFARVLDRFWTGDGREFAAHLESRGDEVAEALLEVTDAQAHHGHHAALAVVYRTLRGHAVAHVRAALPRIGGAIAALVERPEGSTPPTAVAPQE